MPNRVVLSESVKAGDRFQIAILGHQRTDLAGAPPNPVFFREARDRVLQITFDCSLPLLPPAPGHLPAKSNCRLTLAKRAGMTVVGCSHAGPKVLFCARIVLTLSALCRSRLTVLPDLPVAQDLARRGSPPD